VNKMEHLSAEQESMIPIYRDRGIAVGLCCDPIDRDAARDYARRLQVALKRPNGPVIIMSGPVHTWLAACLLNTSGVQVWAQVWDQVWTQVRDQVWTQVRDQVGAQVWAQVLAQVGTQVGTQVGDQVLAQVLAQVRAQVRDQVWTQVRDQVWTQVWAQVLAQVGTQVGTQVGDQVWTQVWDQVRDQVWTQVGTQVRAQVGDQVKNFTWPYLDGHWGASYWAWVSFYQEVLKLKINVANLWVLKEQLHYGPIYPLTNGATVICERPLCIHRLGTALHCENGPAIAYGDGTRVWALHGVRVPQALVETPAEKLDCADWITNANAEVRREFVRKVGAERIMIKLGSQRLDQQDEYELHEIDLKGRTGKWPALKMLNPSIGIWHVEWVDRACRTVAQALEWRNQSAAKPLALT
jgi:hypothetical protein